jgi:2-amino-4-hydroxy-6-hydroxymethyldihydropteridine diphosphokinase
MQAFLGLGANLDRPRARIDEAVRELFDVEGIEIRARSRSYGSAPVGPQDQPDYVNAVVEIETRLDPMPLLRAAQSIEDRMGRVRTMRWGPRVIDIDLLLYDGRHIAEPELVVPHPEMLRRSFVLRPLAEPAPDLVVPGTDRSVAAWAEAVTTPTIHLLDPEPGSPGSAP